MEHVVSAPRRLGRTTFLLALQEKILAERPDTKVAYVSPVSHRFSQGDEEKADIVLIDDSEYTQGWEGLSAKHIVLIKTAEGQLPDVNEFFCKLF
jgi:chromosomal replication initiation ATPase DnaA